MPYIPGNFMARNQETLHEDFRDYVLKEFDKIAQSLAESSEVELRPIHAAPTKPREGMIVSADGTDWDPGSGAGSYEYRGGAWHKL